MLGLSSKATETSNITGRFGLTRSSPSFVFGVSFFQFMVDANKHPYNSVSMWFVYVDGEIFRFMESGLYESVFKHHRFL